MGSGSQVELVILGLNVGRVAGGSCSKCGLQSMHLLCLLLHSHLHIMSLLLLLLLHPYEFVELVP